MADPKFANLPGIAYDQPDIYETPDTPETETSDYYEEEPENESIDRHHVLAKDSFNKFKGKYLTGNVDFSDRIGRKHRTGYDARSGEWELAGVGEQESPIQKCHRLQCEMDQLVQEVIILQADKTLSQEEKDSYEEIGSVVSNARKVLNNLRLEQILGEETVTQAADLGIKSLIAQCEEYKTTGSMSVIKLPEVYSELNKSTRIAELEHQLHKLEKVIGSKPDKLGRLTIELGTNSLLEAVQQLSTKAALLQPNQLDLIEARLTNTISKLNVIKKAPGIDSVKQDLARDQKIVELYDIAKRAELISQVLPDILNRMHALESLHSYATNFSKIIAELQESQQNLAMTLTNNKTLLQGVHEAFAVNLETVNKEVNRMDEKIKAITDKK